MDHIINLYLCNDYVNILGIYNAGKLVQIAYADVFSAQCVKTLGNKPLYV